MPISSVDHLEPLAFRTGSADGVGLGTGVGVGLGVGDGIELGVAEGIGEGSGGGGVPPHEMSNVDMSMTMPHARRLRLEFAD